MFKKIKKFFLVQEIDRFDSDITASDLGFVTDGKIDFIYDEAVKYGKEVEAGRKVMIARATLLLSYLVVASGWLLSSILSKIESDNLPDQFLVLNAGLILIFYAIIIWGVTTFVLTPRFRRPINNEPKNLLIKKVLSYDLKMIKFSEIENLQNRINANHQSQQIPFKILNYSIIGTIVVPMILIAISFLLFFKIF